MSSEDWITIILTMQGQLDTLNDNIEKLIEQVRLANEHRFGRSTETLKSIDGQISFFDEADTLFDPNAAEPEAKELIMNVGGYAILGVIENYRILRQDTELKNHPLLSEV